MKKFLWFICIWSILSAKSIYGHETLDTGDANTGEIGIEEKTGQFIPADLVFYDEEGKRMKIEALFGKPAILTLVYYTCEHICPLMLGGLAQALPRLAALPGKDYRVITVSFDAGDKPETARSIKKNYMKAIGPFDRAPDKTFPEDAWKFLTGTTESIHDLTEAAGFKYRKDIHGFSHPVVLIFLSPEGKISGYFYVTKFQYGQSYPITFSSYDLNMGLTEAAQGKAVTGVRKALLYCFSHEPPGQSKFFNFMAVVGLITLAAMVTFFVYLQVTTRRYRKWREYDADK
ncbi:MAG: SCO family protein [Syntrophales bacterium]